MVFDSYGAGNGGYYRQNPLYYFTAEQLCNEIIRRVNIYGTEITGDLLDQLQSKRNMELLEELAEAGAMKKVEDVT